MDQPYCKTCLFWDAETDPRFDDDVAERLNPEGQLSLRELIEAIDADGNDVEGECHRFPGRAGDNLSERWPRTSIIDWCGEHPDFPAYLASLKSAPAEPATTS